MPIALLLMVVQITLIVHAAKTGRFSPWGYILIFLPGAGALAYIVVELVPEWFGSAQGQRTRGRVVKALDPERRYRELSDQFAAVDTIGTRGALAEECLVLGKYWAALEHFNEILSRPMGNEPVYMLGRARAEFGLGRFTDTVATLDELRQKWPDYQSAEGHLLYARALEESDQLKEAADEYAAVSNYYPGAEARVRYALLLRKAGRDREAHALLEELLAQMRRAPRYVRKVQAEWIRIAEQAVRG
jgi:hypothetical protein